MLSFKKNKIRFFNFRSCYKIKFVIKPSFVIFFLWQNLIVQFGGNELVLEHEIHSI